MANKSLTHRVEHKALWTIKFLNYHLKKVGEKRFLQLQELEELRMDAYENAKIYKENTKRWHDKRIRVKYFKEGDQVLFFNSKFKFFLEKLRSKWSEPFLVLKVFPYRTVELQGKQSTFKVSGQRCKLYTT